MRTVTINGKRFKWYRQAVDGMCDPPGRGAGINVDPRLKGRRELEVVIHECLHGAFWKLSERKVERFAADVARVLWRVGYRRQQEQHDGQGSPEVAAPSVDG